MGKRSNARSCVFSADSVAKVQQSEPRERLRGLMPLAQARREAVEDAEPLKQVSRALAVALVLPVVVALAPTK
jgi:hypothetical protein